MVRGTAYYWSKVQAIFILLKSLEYHILFYLQKYKKYQMRCNGETSLIYDLN